MAHYALLDQNNIVTGVIKGIDETELIEGLDTETWYGNFHHQRCVRTSYNDRIRGHYAGIGDRYDESLDLFIAPKPFESWALRSDGWWEAPVPCPSEGIWLWDETTLSWVAVGNA